MLKIRKNDFVQIIKGKDKGKKGKVLELVSNNQRALVEGLNLVKKHKRQTRQDQKGGIVSIESPISVANVMYFCKGCNRGVRVGFQMAKDGTKTRICKSCKEVV
jgi:large subunit ribosomal protein L24